MQEQTDGLLLQERKAAVADVDADVGDSVGDGSSRGGQTSGEQARDEGKVKAREDDKARDEARRRVASMFGPRIQFLVTGGWVGST